jgi:hypothetical protein
VFVHSLWSEADESLDALADRLAKLLNVRWSGEAPSIGFRIPVLSGPAPDTDRKWAGPGPDLVREQHLVRLYQVGLLTGIAGLDPALNFRLRDDLRASAGLRPVRLRWDGAPFRAGEWALSAVHLHHPSADIDVSMQGESGRQDELLEHVALLPGYDVQGVTVTGDAGQLATVYDEGQIWLQAVQPDDVPGVLERLIPLLQREAYYG